MKVSILDDFCDTLQTLSCFRKLDGYEVEIWNDHVEDAGVLAARWKETEALVLIRERTKISADLLERLPKRAAHQSAQRVSTYRYRRVHTA